MLCNSKAKPAGFSLIELLIGIAVLGLILAGSVTLLSGASRLTNFAAERADRVDSRGFAVNFVERAESSGISSIFLNLPVPTAGCEQLDRPCVRSWDSKGQRFVPAPSSIGQLGPSVQFFSDKEGQLTATDFEFSNYGPGKAKIQKNLALGGSIPENLHATWPLLSDKSAPFVALSSSDKALQLISFSPLATSKTMDHDYVFFEPGSESVTADDLKDNVLLVYNTRSPEVFTIKYVRDAKVCGSAASDSACAGLAFSISPTLDPATLKGKVALEVLSLAELSSQIESFLPQLSQLGLGGEKYRWKHQPLANFLFPTDVATLLDEKGPDFKPPNRLDLRKLQHYFHANRIEGRLVAIPIEILVYRLEENGTEQDGKVIYDLVSYSFAGDKPSRRVELVNVRGEVVFSRELGTNTIALYVGDET